MIARITLLSLLFAGLCQGGVYEEGLEAKKAGRHEEAAQLLGRASQAHPENAEIWLHYGTVLGWLKRHDEALTALRKGLKIAPQDFDLRLAEARVLAWKADYPAASKRLEELAGAHPENLDVKVMQGRVAGWQGDPASARKHYEEVLSRDPNQVDALTGLGDIEAEASHTGEARGLYERALAQDPSPDIQKRLDGLKNTTRARIDFGASGSTFARGERDDWWGFYASYAQKFHGWDLWVRTEVGQRFGLQDETYELGFAGQIYPGIQATVFAGVTPDAGFSANWYGDASVRWRVFKELGPLGQGWLLTEARRAEYDISALWVTRVGWEQAFGGGWTFNARWLHYAYDSGAGTDGWTAFLAWEPKERWLFRIGAGQAVESLTNQTLNTGTAISSWTVFAGVVIPLSDRWHIRLDVEREEVKNSIIRYGASIGAGYRF